MVRETTKYIIETVLVEHIELNKRKRMGFSGKRALTFIESSIGTPITFVLSLKVSFEVNISSTYAKSALKTSQQMALSTINTDEAVKFRNGFAVPNVKTFDQSSMFQLTEN